MANCTNFEHDNPDFNNTGYSSNLLGVLESTYPIIAQELYSKITTDTFVLAYLGQDSYTEQEFEHAINEIINNIALDGNILLNVLDDAGVPTGDYEVKDLASILTNDYSINKTFNAQQKISAANAYKNITLELFTTNIRPKIEDGTRKQVQLIDMPKQFFHR